MNERPVAIGAIALAQDPGATRDGVDVSYLLAILRCHGSLIAALTLAAGAVTVLVTLFTPRLYEAAVVFGATGSKMSDDVNPRATPTFRPMIANHSVAQQIVDRFHLNEAPYFYDAAAFLDKATELEEVRNTNVLLLTVRLREPALAAQVANALAQAAVAYTKSLSEEEGGRARDRIKAEVARSTERLQRASAALAAFNRSAQLELAGADLDALVVQRRSIPALVVQAEGSRAGATQAEHELSDHAKLDVTTRSVLDDPMAVEQVRAAAADRKVPLALSIKSESLNKAYEGLDITAAQNRVDLARAERQLKELSGVRRTDAATLATIRAYHEKKAEHAHLELEQTLAERTYTDVVSRYESARLQVAIRSADLQVIDPAVVPALPVPRGLVSRTCAAVLLAFALATGGALVAGLWRDGHAGMR
jgi:uncharacterized protein involved in exopolysaccharide biosynthesis